MDLPASGELFTPVPSFPDPHRLASAFQYGPQQYSGDCPEIVRLRRERDAHIPFLEDRIARAKQELSRTPLPSSFDYMPGRGADFMTNGREAVSLAANDSQ